MKDAVLKFTLIASAGLLLQACAPNQGLKQADESWLRVTPVDISQQPPLDLPAATAGDSSRVAANPSPPQTSAFDTQSAWVYRFASGFGSRISALSSPSNSFWYSLGEGFQVFKNDNNNRVAIYSCNVSRTLDYFTSRDPNCEGQKKNGWLGYLEKQASTDAPHAVYRCVGLGAHLDTVNEAECTSLNYRVEQILGYTR